MIYATKSRSICLLWRSRLTHLIWKLWTLVICDQNWAAKVQHKNGWFYEFHAWLLLARYSRFDHIECFINLITAGCTDLLYLFLCINARFGGPFRDVAVDFSLFLAHIINIIYNWCHDVPHKYTSAFRCDRSLAFVVQLLLKDKLVHSLIELRRECSTGGSASSHRVDVRSQ